MPNIVPTTIYGWIASDLYRIAIDTSGTITEVEATLCHFHISKVLQCLILATRVSYKVDVDGHPSPNRCCY